MQEYGGSASSKPIEYRDGDGGRDRTAQDSYQPSQHQYSAMPPKNYGCSSKDMADQNMATYCRVATGIYEATTSSQQYQNSRYNNQSAPTFSSPPNSPLVGLVFDPSSPNYGCPSMSTDRSQNEKRTLNSWSTNLEPIGTGAKKKIIKSQDRRNAYNTETRYHDRYKDNVESDRQKKERNLTAESTTSLDFFVEGERMVSELCNIPDTNVRSENSIQKSTQKSTTEDDKTKPTAASDTLLTVLDKIIIHDQIPNQIVQLAIEACTDAENIAIAHHNRPCFKNIHSICAKTRSNVQKPDSAVANLHSQGIPWVIKNFIFSFVRILDGWKGVKELLSEKHDTFSRIENKYYSPNIRECFVQWQAVTKEMLTHIYKTFKCLDHGFTMEQKSFTHNYYASNPAPPRHQNQNKYQPGKSHSNTPRPVSASPQPFNTIAQPPWIHSQGSSSSQNFSDGPWPPRSNASYKKFPIVPPPNSHNFYPLNDHNDLDNYQKSQYKCDPCNIREAKPRQSWTITNVSDFRSLEGMCHSEQRELYNQLKHKMDAELGKAPTQSLLGHVPCDILQRRDMEIKAKMIPLSHVEKSLIPSMTTSADMRGCYMQKNNSCGDTKEEADFFAAWGQMVQKEPSDYIAHHTHNIQIPSNIVIPNNISGPVQFIDSENDEFHEMSKVYMKPGSYKVPIKPADPITAFAQGASQEVLFDSSMDEINSIKMKIPFPTVTLSPQPKYNIESWPCLMGRRIEDVFSDDSKLMFRHGLPCLDMRIADSLDFLNSMTSDRAWEAAKESAPKLMDFIHEGSNKSDAARLYDALGLNTNDDTDDLKQGTLNVTPANTWVNALSTNPLITKEMSSLWTTQMLNKDDYALPKGQDHCMFADDIVKLLESDSKPEIEEPFEPTEPKKEESKESKCANFDQTGNYVRDDNQKKSSGRSKVAVSGMWYHPKKKKPLQSSIVKKFETILTNLSRLNEAGFIQHDMDIKMAPRFYEVVKYPMCLHDITTKLKNSSYTEYEQVVQDFRRIFNNVRQYLKSFPDSVMKKNVNKISSEFEKMLSDEFQSKWESKTKHQDNTEPHSSTNRQDEKETAISQSETSKKDHRKMDSKPNTNEDKK